MLRKAIQARPRCYWNQLAIHPQMRKAFALRPLGQIGVQPLAIDHQGCEYGGVAPLEITQHARGNRIQRLRLNRHITARAMLSAELHPHQAQKVINLGECGHRRFASSARHPLLDGDRGRNAVNRIHIGPRGGLHKLPRIGVQRFKIAALAFVKNNVKRERRFART